MRINIIDTLSNNVDHKGKHLFQKVKEIILQQYLDKK